MEKRKVICGIYKITNKINGKVYIGKAVDIFKRFLNHQRESKKEDRTRRASPLLYNSMRKHGADNFEVEVLEVLDRDEEKLKERELFWMDNYASCNRCCGYDLRRDSSTNMTTHPETIDKMRQNLKEQWANGIRDQHSKKLTESWKDDENRKAEQSERFSNTLTKYKYKIYTL